LAFVLFSVVKIFVNTKYFKKGGKTMKRRLLAFTLALTMTFTTLFTVNADDSVAAGDSSSEVSDEISDEEVSDGEISDAEEVSGGEISDDEEVSDVENSGAEEVSDDEVSDENASEEASEEAESSIPGGSSESISDDTSETTTEATTDGEISLAAGNESLVVVKDWVTGMTGGKNELKENSDGTVSTVRKASNSGKFSETADEFAYYAPKVGVDMTKDFTFSATMNINGLLTYGDTNQAQCSAGMIVMAPIQKTPPSVSVGIAMRSNSVGYIGANKRTAFPEEVLEAENYKFGKDGNYKVQPRMPANKNPNEWVKLSANEFNDGANRGSYDLKIEKIGNSYTVYCGDQKIKYDYAKENFMGGDGTNELIFPALYAARDVDIKFSNIKLEIDNRVQDGVVILENAADNTAFVGNEPKLSGIRVGIHYTDGSVKEITEGYEVKGYDVNKAGKQTAKITVGEFSADYEIEMLRKNCTKIEIISTPMKIDYYEGQYFRTDNFVVEADYEDGSHAVLDREDYDLIVKGKVIEQDQFFTTDLAGDNLDFTVRRKTTPEIGSGGKSASFKGSVSPLKLDHIVAAVKPAKTVYYVDEMQDLKGMLIKGYYTDGTNFKTVPLQESEYKVSYYKDNKETFKVDKKTGKPVLDDEGQKIPELDTSDLGKRTIRITSVYNDKLIAEFEISIMVKKFMKATITSYPRTTYPILKDTGGHDAKYWYDYYNGKPDGSAGTVADETSQYNQGNLQITYLYSSGEEVIAPASEYEIILDNFDLTNASKENNQIVIRFPESSEAYGTADIVLPITVKDYSVNYWKPTTFGATATATESSDPAKEKMGLVMKEADGTVTRFNTKGSSGTATKVDPNGTVYKDRYVGDRRIEEPGTTLNIWANGGSGKAADSNDGIAYYYTRLNFNDDFKLSADIEVNSYVNGDTDENRDGQEGFGILARDIISLTPSEEYKEKVIADGGTILNGDKKVQFVYKYDDAARDEYGEPIPYNTAIYNYANMVMIAGFSGSGWPSDPEADTYLFNTTKNRINLIYRTFIEGDPYAASSNVFRSSVKNTLSRDFPSPGSKYHISLEKLPGGYRGVCYDYQSKEFKTDYIRYDEEAGETDLNVLDPDNIYVGFFATRYADINISNVSLVKSAAETDMESLINETDKLTVPKLYLKSNVYSSKTDYNLVLRTSNNSGGKVTIQQDGKVIYNNVVVNKRETVYPVKLPANDKSKFTIMYTPTYISPDSTRYQELSTYDPSYYEWTITHKGNFDASKENIFVAPDLPDEISEKIKNEGYKLTDEERRKYGKAEGTGDIDDPMPFDTAYGLMKRGQKIILLPGTYLRTAKLEIAESNAGSIEEPKSIIGFNKYQAEEDGYAVEGYQDVPDGIAEFDMNEGNNGIVCHASYWLFKNFSITNGGKNAKAFHVGGDGCIIENVKVHDCQDSGINLSRTSSSQKTVKDWPKNNIFKNCEVWNCADASFNNSDGFATKLTVGVGNKLIGCVSHHNSDDGWDLFCKQSGGYMAPVTLEKCITYRGGYKLTEDGTDRVWSESRGGKNGFKMGGDYMPINNVLIDCIAFENGNSGVTANSNPLMTVRGCVAYMNEGSNFSMGSNSSLSNCRYDVKGLVSYKPQSGKSNGGDSITGFESGYEVGKDADGNPIMEYRDKDYNYIKKSSEKESMNASGEIVTADFFVSLESPLVGGRIPQDPATGEFLLNGFLELKPEVKARIQSVEGYEDIEETTEQQESTTEGRKDVSGTRGGGSSKKNNSVSGINTSDGDKASNNNVSNENSGTDNNGSGENGGTNNNGSGENGGTNNNGSNESNTNVNNSNVSADNGGEVTIPSSLDGKVSVQVSGGNGISVKVDGGSSSDIEKITEVKIPFDGDTSNPDLIVAVFTDKNGNETIITQAQYIDSIGKVVAPFIGEGDYSAVLKSVSFADMTNNWAKPYVEALAVRGIVNGVADNMFAPNANIKRCDFVLMLTKVLDINSSEDAGFSDVKSSDYFSGAISAAKEYGLVKGISDNEFGAKANISRQDVMTIIARTLDAAGVDLRDADLSKFSDAANVSDYAKDSVAKLVGANIIAGNNGAINPKNSLTRAEAAKILYEVWKMF